MKKTATDQYKALLSHTVGGEVQDWKRRSKKKTYGGDIDRNFENKELGIEVLLTERTDGLLFAELPNGSKLTARLSASGVFNKAAKPSVVDIVMNMILNDEEAPKALIQQAVKEGLVSRFSFCVSHYAGEMYGLQKGEESLFACIYPSVRDSTFKTTYDYVMPMVPKGSPHDECMETEWYFSKEINTPAKVAKHLMGLGFTWDKEMQKRQPEVFQEIEAALRADARKSQKKPQA